MNSNKPGSGWSFTDREGSFVLENAHKTSYLYFPLSNESGMMSSISPLLGGDAKSGQNTFLLPPVSPEDLHNSRAARNFWVYIEGFGAWSASGNSAKQIAEGFEADSDETVTLEAGFLWHKVNRENKSLGIKAEITNFVPVTADKVELMRIKLVNTGKGELAITPTAAIPLYGRSADNIRDHRHVTSLLHRISTTSKGVVVKPTLSFDERGHKINEVSYSISGAEGNGTAPIGFFPVVEDFIGEGGTLDWPEAIVKNGSEYCSAGEKLEGYEAMGGLRFNRITLKPGETKSYIIALAIHEKNESTEEIEAAYCSEEAFERQLEDNITFWREKLRRVNFQSGNPDFDSWVKWVTLQPILRRIYGCSFLPHHDYGRGGRGWRDLWQDCLALLVMDPEEVRELLLNNYAGVRIDGSNATIIGSKPGEFLADRNNIARIWMDHGAWPFLTTNLYINQSGDLEFLLQEQSYFKDKQCFRSKDVDTLWNDEYGSKQKDEKGNLYSGSILEHILIQNLTPFFNVGEHNNIRLEGADWNDAFDMAPQKGESVAFTALYGSNLMELSELLKVLKKKLNVDKVHIAREMGMLFDSIEGGISYDSITEKHELLNRYFSCCKHNVSGEKVSISIEELSEDLKRKAQWIFKHLREKEWIENREGYRWFNGYYDNAGERVEGDHEKGVRMTLTGQVFAIMGGVAQKEQISDIVASAKRYLFEERIGGYRLNTNFKEVKLNMGRGFGFAFGHKENGSMFSHMAVMFSNGLYKKGFAKEGYEVLSSIFAHCRDFESSRIYPGIPEYINEKGRGMYSYLTGSASWYLLTMLNEVYGVRGAAGDLMLNPKLVKEQFDAASTCTVTTWFAGRELNIKYCNPDKLDFGQYSVVEITIDGRRVEYSSTGEAAVISRDIIKALDEKTSHHIIVMLK
jgi:cellobiose phosphorylase